MNASDTYREIPVAGGGFLNPYPVGTRVRNKRHPELTGTIKCMEWNARGVLSAIPYNVSWDDSSRAADELGWFWIYATHEALERIEDAA